MPDGTVILLTITRHETKVADDGQVRMSVWTPDKKKYTHFVNADDGDWSKQLTNDGKQVYVYLQEKEGTWNGKPITFRNIYKPNDPVPPVPVLNAQGIPVSPPPASKLPEPPAGFFTNVPPEQAQPEHVPYISDKDTKIRWMNAMNNAVQIVAGLDLKKLGEPQIKNYIIEYANFFNTLESGMTIETLPISKSQTIKLHEIAKSFGLNHEDYHAVLKAITGRTIAKTTDLVYNEAVECILQFDTIMKKGDIFNKPTPPPAILLPSVMSPNECDITKEYADESDDFPF